MNAKGANLEIQVKMSKPTLEGLPTELLILILLEISDQSSLKSIVLSSSTLHQAYLTARPEVLLRILHRQYGPFLGEAVVAVRSRGLCFASHEQEAITLLDTWRRSGELTELALPTTKQLHNLDGLEEMFSLFRFHKQLKFFLEDLTSKALRPPWLAQDDWDTSI
ncbi:uncharacterized protein N7511_002223 [Penicillium nucicola]|uniref:uncharacterized protein n=1 Tax=Penicillium nucicola TaxID=1850975 RepID=UPI002544D438|nr:uncharacterized protein N7511_002223 [Penicillium nucicola]KAJ5770172.1 hypothetical protein N7511_002223 [Penicillium nucicola]